MTNLPPDILQKQFHYHTVGDTLTPLGFELRRRSLSGDWEWVDLTGKEIQFRMVDEDGEPMVDDEVAVITDAEAGQGQYDFFPDEVAEPGIYYAWVRVIDPLTLEVDTFPVGGRRWVIVLREAA
jgi:hypothetical protein